MFIDSRVNHFKFGSGTITNIEMNLENQLKSKVCVNFDSGKTSKFSMDSFGENGFFETDDEIINYVNLIRKEEKEKKIAFIENRKKENTIKHSNIDEFDNEVSIDRWKRAAKMADVHRFYGESRAVVMDSDIVFINASAAMRYIEARVKDCDKIYKSCETRNKKFMGHHWSYASKEVIENIISEMED